MSKLPDLFLKSLGRDDPALREILTLYDEFCGLKRSQRTRRGLEQAREEGVKLGRPREVRPEVVEQIHSLYQSLGSYSGTARRLNAQGILPPRGRAWYPSSIKRVIAQ